MPPRIPKHGTTEKYRDSYRAKPETRGYRNLGSALRPRVGRRQDTGKVVVDCRTKIPILEELPECTINTDAALPRHWIIEGDNYHALTTLQRTHSGKIDLIYIDPPYNTGKTDDFMYNDRYVDAKDEYRHSKWLSFINKRLRLAKPLLAESGLIFISIDDTEIAQLKLLCNQILGEENFIAQFIRKNKAGAGHDSGQIAIEFDYMLCYAKNRTEVKFRKEIVDVENDKKYRYEDAHLQHRGKYYLRDLDYKGSYSESMDYAMDMPDGSEIFSGGRFGKPIPGDGTKRKWLGELPMTISFLKK